MSIFWRPHILLNPKWILNNQSYAIVHYFCIKRPAPALRYGVCYVNLAFKLALLYRDLDRGFPRVWVHPYINTNVSILLESQVFSTFHNSEQSIMARTGFYLDLPLSNLLLEFLSFTVLSSLSTV